MTRQRAHGREQTSRRGFGLGGALVALVGALWASGCAGLDTRPEHEDPGVVSLTGALGNRFVPAGAESEVVARVRLGAGAVPGARRPPINLALVLDTSGSMAGQPIADARAATEALLDALEPGDRLALVTFNSDTEVVQASTALDDGARARLREQVRSLEAEGTTDLAGGLSAGLEEVTRQFNPRGINRVVLLSDGVPNDPSMVRPLATAAGERGIAVTALGLGLDYDEVLLGDVAVASGGRFHYVERSEQVASVFRDEVLRLTRTVARNVFVELRPGPGVAIESVVGPAFSVANGRVYIALGELAEAAERDLLVRMRVSGRRAGAAVELLDAVVAFDDAAFEAGHFERHLFLGARSTASEAELVEGRDLEVERDAARMMAAAVTVEAIRLARGGELERARATLASAASEAREAADAGGDDVLRGRAEEMRVLSGYLPALAPAAATTRTSPGAPSLPDEAALGAVRVVHDEAMSELGGY